MNDNTEYLRVIFPGSGAEQQRYNLRSVNRLFMSEDEIVSFIFKSMNEAQVMSWTNISRDDLIAAHHTTGQSIRNAFGLWDENNQHVNLGDPSSDDFPDQMSMRIMERVWDAVCGDRIEKPDA